MNKILLGTAFSLLLVSCNTNPENNTANRENSAKTDTVAANQQGAEPQIDYHKTYEGILPCVDCKGIKTTLRITEDFQKFKLTEEFLGGGPKPKSVWGNLNTERAFENDKEATVYVLNYDQPVEKQQYFVRESGKEIQVMMLDNNRKRMPESQKFVLTEITITPIQ